jgi:flagellar biosynthesis activator protein FlaF
VNATQQALAAYAAGPASVRSGRSTEHQVFADVTARLSSAAAAGPGAFGRLAAALHDNRRLWTRLAADVADDGNGLPRNLRAQIFYLAEFTDHHSRRILRGEGAADALIDINLAVMRGLAGQPGTAAAGVQ